MAGSVARIVVLALANGLQHAGREEADRVDAHRRLLDLALDLLIIPFHRFGDRCAGVLQRGLEILPRPRLAAHRTLERGEPRAARQVFQVGAGETVRSFSEDTTIATLRQGHLDGLDLYRKSVV